MITSGSGSFIIERELSEEKKNLDFYHMLKPIFYFSNGELKKKIILQREFLNLHQSVVQLWN